MLWGFEGKEGENVYLDAYKLFMSNGILFNHESEVRGTEFVTRKISRSVAKICHGSKEPYISGNLSAVSDRRFARVYVEGIWIMFKHDYPDDFVLGTGESHTVREFAEAAFKEIDMDIEWIGSGMNEVGLSEGMTRVKVSREFFRPLESDNYRADYRKAKEKLGWKPTTMFKDLVDIMVRKDIERYL